MKNLLLVVLITTLSCTFAAHGEITKEKRKEVEKMLRLTGMVKLVDQIKVQMIDGLKTEMTDVPAGFWDKFQKRLDARDLIEKIIPLYDKYYTLEDLKAVNAFYESPAGEKVLSTLPQITQESMKVGQEWGEKVAKQAVAELERESKKKKK